MTGSLPPRRACAPAAGFALTGLLAWGGRGAATCRAGGAAGRDRQGEEALSECTPNETPWALHCIALRSGFRGCRQRGGSWQAEKNEAKARSTSGSSVTALGGSGFSAATAAAAKRAARPATMVRWEGGASGCNPF